MVNAVVVVAMARSNNNARGRRRMWFIVVCAVAYSVERGTTKVKSGEHHAVACNCSWSVSSSPTADTPSDRTHSRSNLTMNAL